MPTPSQTNFMLNDRVFTLEEQLEHANSWSMLSIGDYFAERDRQQQAAASRGDYHDPTGPTGGASRLRSRANAAGYGNAAFLAEQRQLPNIAEHRAEVDPGDRIPCATREEETETVLRVRDSLAETKTPGKSQIIVDVGSNVNAVGKVTLDDHISRIPEDQRHQIERIPRQHPMNINGVGEGATTCYDMVKIPIAVKWNKDQPQSKSSFVANVATGIGENLPAIMGNLSMTENDVVLVMREGKQTMIFPGAGGYKIVCSPGSKFLPMDKARSGHLVIESDHFSDQRSSATETTTTFVLDHSRSQASGSGDPQGLPPTPEPDTDPDLPDLV